MQAKKVKIIDDRFPAVTEALQREFGHHAQLFGDSVRGCRAPVVLEERGRLLNKALGGFHLVRRLALWAVEVIFVVIVASRFAARLLLNDRSGAPPARLPRFG